MRDILDSTIRKFVSLGSGIQSSHVIPGMLSYPAPDDVLYASVFMMNEKPMGYSTYKQHIDEIDSFVVTENILETNYSVQFFREGALDAANRFVDWARSQTGINWASSAVTDGRIKACNVYAGGDGYSTGANITFTVQPGTPSSDLPHVVSPQADAVVSDRGGLVRVIVRNFGAGYYEPPVVTVSGGSGAKVSARGFGFSVGMDMMVRNLTEVIDDEFEERAQIDLKVCHTRTMKDIHSGRVESIIEDN